MKRKIFRFIQFSLGMIGTDVLTLPKNKRKRVCALIQIWPEACTKGEVVSDTKGEGMNTIKGGGGAFHLSS
ncbi:hypothetical protein [Bacteroides cellulosilyticus]|uniref:hypothetical protein n=1 Tax=Bacteroides cellulosilyticus TaxID=246787 RepID=UPI0032EE8E7C